MKILAIETSCDETSASVIETLKNDKKVNVLSNIISSSLPLHSVTGGIIPETAARAQLQYIIPVINKSLGDADIKINDLDALAVTIGPGLIGSLLVGVETAKTLAYAFNKPIIPVNHLIGHIYANFIDDNKPQIEFPAIVLIVSGGHTDLLLMKGHGKLKWLGGTRDDATGEAFDKIGRLLKLTYPGGPAIEVAAKKGKHGVIKLPRPLFDSPDFDFSFSGLKTAVLRYIQNTKLLDKQTINDISTETQNAIVDVLTVKTIKAALMYKTNMILICGGVAANETLRKTLENICQSRNIKLISPAKKYCSDNAAMIGTAAFYNKPKKITKVIEPVPDLYFA